MNRIYTSLFFAFLFCSTHMVQAQFAQGCDGVRYSEDIFDDYTMTTVQYGTNADAAGNSFDLEMDIYQPVGDMQEKRPLMIWSHGGAFIGGDRTNMADQCEEFVKKGFVTATISYRLYPTLVLGIPDSLEMMDAAMKSMGDLKAAIRHFRQDADTDNLYKIDPDYILVGGLSAGAIMAVHVAYLDENDDMPDFMEDILNDNGGLEGSTESAANQSYSSDVVATINISGALHRRGWVSPGEQPLASFHGTNDDVVPYNHGVASVLGFDFMSLDGSGVLHQRADDLGIYNYHVAAQGGGHDASEAPAFESDFTEFETGALVFIQNVLCSEITSTEDNLQEAQVLIYPNPAKDAIQLEVVEFTKGYSVELYDQMGRQVRSYSKQFDYDFQIDRGSLTSGVYFLQINFNDADFAPLVRKVTFQ